jgi:hypothetical protein
MLLKSRFMIGLVAAFIAGTALADIQHIVVFRYRADVAAATKADLAAHFLALKDLATRDGQRYIVSITGGQAISKEGFDQGLEQAFVVTFKNEADRNYFVGKPYSDTMDPAHQALVQMVVPLIAVDAAGKLSGIFVFDFSDVRSAR